MTENEQTELKTLSAKFLDFKNAYLICRASVQTEFLARLRLSNERLANQLQAIISTSVRKLPRKSG